MSALHPADYRDPSEGGLWTSLNRFVGTLIAVIIATAIGYRMMPELGRQHDQTAQMEALRIKIDKEKQSLARHVREEYLLRNDPEYGGLIARDRLDLMKEGETIVRLEPRLDPSKMRLKQ